MFTIFFHNFVHLNPLPSQKQQGDGFALEFLLKGPQTELRTPRQNCEQNLRKLRTNRIMNKRAFLNIACLVFMWCRASIAEIPFLRRNIAPQAHARQGRDIALNLFMLRHTKPNSAEYGRIAEIVLRWEPPTSYRSLVGAPGPRAPRPAL